MQDGLEAHPCGSGFTYTMHGRPWTCSNRCRQCGDFGRFDDTERCVDCEEHINTAVAESQAARTLPVLQAENAQLWSLLRRLSRIAGLAIAYSNTPHGERSQAEFTQTLCDFGEVTGEIRALSEATRNA